MARGPSVWERPARRVRPVQLPPGVPFTTPAGSWAAAGSMFRKLTHPPAVPMEAFTRHIDGVPLITQVQTIVAAAGTAQVRIGPAGIGTVWFPVTAAFSTTTGPSDGSFAALYLNAVNAANILNGQLYSGGGDTAALALPQLNLGDYIVAEWVEAHPGDTATLVITGNQSALAY
jgi:hypothetical protein